jgi:ribosomal protein S18 acetylase RimI-like enzyme
LTFYRDVVGLPLALEVPERGAAFLWIGRPGRAMLGLWSIGSAPMNMQLHVAFGMELDEVLGAPAELQRRGVEPLSFFAEPADEPSVIGWMPAAAVYFRDPDGHLLEYLAMLDGPARPELGIIPWSQSGFDARAAIRIEPYSGPRDELRALFELAEDSSVQLSSYIGAGEVLVARSGKDVVGHVQLTGGEGPGQLEIKSVAVAPPHQHRGVGRRLVEAALGIARERGYASVRVATATADVDNVRFYQRLGFRLRTIDRDAFDAASGYEPGLRIDGIALRDRVWLDLDLAGQ